MAFPKAYDPQPGYTYQVLGKESNERELRHWFYAVDRVELKRLLPRCKPTSGTHHFKTITLPKKYWPKENAGE